ncbi:mechanosensitive ion channel family protein [Candidatus Woesearchaeota archaeon]|nr:mechanosensitive ion channel family protein [Candidatus Woesearchaeota archaeon]
MAFLETMLWGNNYKQYIILIVCIIVGIAAGKIFYFISSKIIRALTAKTKTKIDDFLTQLLERPIIFLIILWGVYLGIWQLNLSGGAENIANKIFVVLFSLNISWVIINIIDAIIVNYVKPKVEKSKSDLDNNLLPIIRKVVKVVFWIIVIIMVIKNFGFDVSALLTGVGLGGLAFALAAQELLSNLFGGVAILTDKPFKIGDRIKVGVNEGWVREIGLRTTRIETLDGTQLVIPNAEIAKSVLENVSREKARKVKLSIGIEYHTSQKKIIQAQKIIRDVVVKHKFTEDESIAALTEFGDSALIILIIYWVKESNVDKLMQIKNDINLAIKEKFEKSGISMAFPTRTVHLVTKRKS